MKVIDLINDLLKYRDTQPEKLPKRINFNDMEFEFKDNSYYSGGITTNIMNYIDHTFDLMVEVKIIDTFEDIGEMNLDVDCTCEWNFGECYDTINQLIRNQKKIISKLDKE